MVWTLRSNCYRSILYWRSCLLVTSFRRSETISRKFPISYQWAFTVTSRVIFHGCAKLCANNEYVFIYKNSVCASVFFLPSTFCFPLFRCMRLCIQLLWVWFGVNVCVCARVYRWYNRVEKRNRLRSSKVHAGGWMYINSNIPRKALIGGIMRSFCWIFYLKDN